MIDTKYGSRYPMPHSIVHIEDNSMYTGALPTIVADDPSMYSTIVVTGLPMGVDNRMTTVTRDDVLNTAFGVSGMSRSDRKKYGQCCDYPLSLIRQGAPVRLLRVTPEGSTFGLSCVLVQWRIDEVDNKVHVRFKEAMMPAELQLDRFKNTKKLNDFLVRHFRNDTVIDGDYTWKQRVFVCNISAGRGKVYNYMATAINPTTQSKRPANVKYQFVTIDTRTNQICERFNASLINTDNGNRADAIESVNVIVNRRMEGSSIIIPYINEQAIVEVYNDYIAHFKNMLDSTSTDEFVKNAFLAMNVNTFDILYGKYIYDGTDIDASLPFYQVDMYDTEVASLPTTNRVNTISSDFDVTNPTVLYNKIKPLMYGLTRNGDNVYVGDMYLSTVGSSSTNITITIVGAINQYTGAVTSLTIPKMYPLKNVSSSYVVDKTTNPNGVSIATIFNDTATGTGSRTLNNMVVSGTLVAGDIVALVSGNTFNLFTIMSVTPTASTGDRYTLSPAYTEQQLYDAIAWNSHSSGATGVGNIIGISTSDAAFTRVGATVINPADGSVYVNDYNYTYNASDPFDKGRILIRNNSRKFGTCPTDVNITTDIVGAEYDVLVHDESLVTGWKVNSATIADGGLGYVVGERFTFSTGGAQSKTIFRIDSVDEDGAVTGISVVTQLIENSNVVGSHISTSTATGDGEGLKISITTSDIEPAVYTGTPLSIDRYVVVGVQGSLFRVSKNAVNIPANYYSDDYGINMTSEVGGVRIKLGSTGFFDDDSMSEIEFKWRYSALLVKAYRGQIDPRIMSPTRVPAKYMFDAGHNTIVGQTILPYLTYAPIDIINASTIFTDDEKDEVMFNPQIVDNITDFEDIDVKQAMYDLMVYRCYQGIPEDKQPIGPGSGISLHLDSGITDANTAMLINTSFANRFDNPNASWDIGGWIDNDGVAYTFTKQIVDNLCTHCRLNTVNKPYVGKYTTITKDEYSSYFPDIDTTDWDMRTLFYNSGGNTWIADINGNLTRRSQRTLMRGSDTSDLIQENNMRTLSQLTYLLQNKINEYLLEYDDDGVIKTMSDEVNNMFSNWVGRLVDSLDISFQRDTNIDGGEILVCYCSVAFRGLILRVPIIVNINRRVS